MLDWSKEVVRSGIDAERMMLDRREKNKVRSAKWIDMLKSVKRDVELVNQRITLLVGLLKTNPTDELWKQYYRERVLTMRNKAVHVSARLAWTSCDERADLTRQDFQLLNLLASGFMNERTKGGATMTTEDELHVLEVRMDTLIEQEARRILRQHYKFFQEKQGPWSLEHSLEL